MNQVKDKVAEIEKSSDKNPKIIVNCLKNNDELRRGYAKLKSQLCRSKTDESGKLKAVTKALQAFFDNAGSSYEQRCIVFCNNRDVVADLQRFVSTHTNSRIRAQYFVGHGRGSGNRSVNINQKEQGLILEK